MNQSIVPLRRALISVADKTALLPLAKVLIHHQITILATDGTAQLLREANLPVTSVADYLGFAEVLNGRVKTLHPKIHAGILARGNLDDDELSAKQIEPIDLVIANLYPFAATIANPRSSLSDAIEQIDIGGPTMIRAAAKNFLYATVITNPADYPQLVAELAQFQGTRLAQRQHWALKAFQLCSQYDQLISQYLQSTSPANGENSFFPNQLTVDFTLQQVLRYGENPHQQAAWYRSVPAKPMSISACQQLQGKALSYNNILDSDTALECVKSFRQCACVIIKHANPCGIAIAQDLPATPLNAYLRAFAADPESAFGGIIAFNRPLDAITADAIIGQQFAEVIIAPQIAENSLAILATKKNIRVLTYAMETTEDLPSLHFHTVQGGLLVQTLDQSDSCDQPFQVVSKRLPRQEEIIDLRFAWQAVKWVKSNAIVYVKQQQTLGIGAGQTSRVNSAFIAKQRALAGKFSLLGAVMASDAFLPFCDSIAIAAQTGITAIIQPGGSIRDQQVIAAADEAQIAMVFTGQRHLRH